MEYDYYVPDETPKIAQVRFDNGNIVYIREVNIIFDGDAMDVDATEERIKRVGDGVSRKIEIGLINATADESEDEMFFECKADPSISRTPDSPADV